jgi:hypothetical protein
MSRPVDRSEIEDKLRQIQTEVDTAAGTAMPAAVTVGAIAVAGAMGAAYFFGQRSSKKRTTVVEVRRQ